MEESARASGEQDMRMGVPKEIKVHEYRVGMTPASVREVVHNGHQVVVETNAGVAIGLPDESYIAAGAEIAANALEVFASADMIVKVKEPQLNECAMLRDGQILFTYLHLAPNPDQAKALMESRCVAIAYETVTDRNGGLPLLAPMSEVAGRMSIQAGAHCLEMEQGGRGQLLGGVPGVPAAKVVVIGGGVAGTNAARMAMGLEAHVTIIDINLDRLYELDMQFGPKLNTIFSTVDAIEEHVLGADLVDISIDQGGCFATSRPTTHADPTYLVDDVVHYCVANMPGAVARTSTFALNNATLPFMLALANKGYRQALADDPHLLAGLNVHHGAVTYAAVASALGEPFQDAASVIAA